MPELISKVQHKTYEKGEFSDEKQRSLDDTISLIKDFLWDTERTLTDIQLTGPSVTIKDEDLNYLKIGLFFNGKFCLYYLDNESHLYEYHAPTIEDVCSIVTDFFNEGLDLQKFEKKTFSLGSRKHFENGYFEYTLNKTWNSLYILFAFAILIPIMIVTVVIALASMYWLMPLYLILDLLYIQGIYFMVMVSLRSRNLSLNITSGQDYFQFGNEDDRQQYDKKDISEINISGQTSRSLKTFNLMDVVFKDGTTITIPGVIIEPFLFASKFPGYKITYINGYIKGLKALWKFIKNK
ncbi:hypothetical protein [Mucilaginibacter sp.]